MRTAYRVLAYLLALSVAVQASLITFGAFALEDNNGPVSDGDTTGVTLHHSFANPKRGTNNNYSQDGYGSSTKPNTGGSYSECAGPTQPGVGPIDNYLAALPYKTFKNCQAGRYYLLNNYNAGYNIDDTVNTAPYTVPPQKSDYVTIGDSLSAHGISWITTARALSGRWLLQRSTAVIAVEGDKSLFVVPYAC